MKRIIFILLLPLLPYCVVAQGTLVDTVRVLTLQQIPYGSLVDSVSTLYIQNGSWKRQTLDSLAKYIATKNGGGSGTVTSITAGAGLTGGTITTTGTIAADTATVLASKTWVNNRGFLTSEVDGSTTNEIQTVDQFSISNRIISLSLSSDGQAPNTLTLPGDSTTVLVSDSIVSYRVNGVEYLRDTIKVPSVGGGGSGSISGIVAGEVAYGVGTDAVSGESALFYDATNNRLSVGGETSPTATLQVKGGGITTQPTILIEDLNGTDKFQILDNGAIEIGRNTTSSNNVASISAIGAESDIGIAIVTKGNGAITASIPTGTVTGGGTRGANAIDFQRTRQSFTHIASGGGSIILNGGLNVASGANSVVLNGGGHISSGAYSVILNGGNPGGLGSGNQATSDFSTVLNGINSVATAQHTVASGVGANANLYGQFALASNGGSDRYGQNSIIKVYRSITGTTQTELTLDGTAPAAGTRAILNLPTGNTNGRLWNAKIQVVAIVQTQGDGTVAVGSSLIGNYAVGIKRILNTTSLVGTVQNLHAVQADTGMETSVVTIDADDTNEALRIRFTPPTAAGSTTVIRVVATVYLTEVGY